ncbi:MAG: serine/threonine protein kinase [Alcanivoracaceae bacterium]|nr:serine/threonine protein kinase [Alcanivoracaceae bacterium]
MTAVIPKYISKYRIDGVLGQGAMGIVYLGFDESIERKVAIKTIAISSNNESLINEYTQRFEQEAKALAKCTHPNIVTILEFGHEDKLIYMVLEYISGMNLDQFIKQTKTMGLMQVLSYFTQLLKALHAAHRRGIIHRDIKPENVLMVNHKTIKLTDFGIAKLKLNDKLTQLGMTLGTPRYMAPEQLFGNDEIGEFTDIYSLFVLLYEMLGTVKNQEHYDFVKFKTLPQIAKHNKLNNCTMIPSCMLDFIDKGLKVSYLDRFQTITSVIDQLKPILNTLNKIRSNITQDHDNYRQKNKQNSMISGSTISGSSLEFELELNNDQFDQLREYLSELIGPMSDFIITDAIKHNKNYDDFIMSIAEKIAHNNARENFIDTWRKY